MKRLFSVIIGLVVGLCALQAQNSVKVSDVNLMKGESAIISVELVNETEFSAFQMDLKLPEGIIVPMTLNEDEDEVLDIVLNEDRKKSTHSLSYNILGSGAIRIASFSSTNAAYKGNSGEIIRIRVMAEENVLPASYAATLSNVLFTTAEAEDKRLNAVEFRISYSENPTYNIEINNGGNGRCFLENHMVEANDTYTLSRPFENNSTIALYFVPFEGYTARSMTRNGEIVSIENNIYEEIVIEDVVFAEVNYEKVVDTVVVTETIIDTLVVTKVVSDTILIETVDTLFIAEIEELPEPRISCENGVVSITCEQDDVVIFYAVNGDPLEGTVYIAPFEIDEDAVVSAVAIKCSEKVELNVTSNGIVHSQMDVVSRRYYTLDGIEVLSPGSGITIVIAEYRDGTQSVYKLLKK